MDIKIAQQVTITELVLENQKLKQERDEAITRRMETIMQCELYEQERDEARNHLKDIEEYGTEEINAAVELRQKLAQALCGDESSSVYINVIHARQLESERDKWAKLCGQYKQERDEARKAARRYLSELKNNGK